MSKTRVSNNYIASNPDYDVRKVTNPDPDPSKVGDIQIVTTGMSLPDYDAYEIDRSAGTKDVINYYSGGLGATLVASIRFTFTDSTKTVLQIVERLS